MANDICDFFHEKVNKIRTELCELRQQLHSQDVEVPVTHLPNESCLCSFSPVSAIDVKKIIMSSKNKTSALDPIPTSLLKEIIDTLLPVITEMINLSFSSSHVPSCWKLAAVIPLLKKILLGFENFTNLRPVSTLPFVSKIAEKIASKQMKTHKSQNNLNEKFQSSYKEGHSTETALIRIHNDLLTDIDKKQAVFLVLLDMSAAFDTVDHAILLTRLETRFGICDAALQWIKSYLSNQRMYVAVDGVQSLQCVQDCNVPQGSVCGPTFFCDYTSPIADIFEKHHIPFHLYADDTQIYVPFSLKDEEKTREKLELCIKEVRSWLCANYLKLNDTKTDFIILGSKYDLCKVKTSEICVGNETIGISKQIKNIGAFLINN